MARELKRPAHRRAEFHHSEFQEEARQVFSIPLYDAKSCAEIVEYVKGLDDWSSALVRFEAGHKEYVTAERPDDRIAKILGPAQTRDLLARFDEKMDEIVKPLIKNIFGVSLSKHVDTQILRYPPGGHYIPHQDVGSDLLDRYFTVVCYLNDDFDGGRTWFPSLNYSVVPQAGKAVFFPASFFHCAQPVIKGEKFAIISWISGPVPLKWI